MSMFISCLHRTKFLGNLNRHFNPVIYILCRPSQCLLRHFFWNKQNVTYLAINSMSMSVSICVCAYMRIDIEECTKWNCHKWLFIHNYSQWFSSFRFTSFSDQNAMYFDLIFLKKNRNFPASFTLKYAIYLKLFQDIIFVSKIILLYYV